MSVRKFYIQHPPTKGNQNTYFAADYASGVNSIDVKNTDGFSADEWIVLGRIGFEQAEIIKISAITDNNTLALATNTKFAHNKDSVITLIDFDKVKVYKSTTGASGTFTLVTTVDIEIDHDTTVYEASGVSTTDYFKFSPYNSDSEVEGDKTDAIAGTGYVFYSARTMVDRVLSLFGDANAEFVSRDEVMDYLNEIYEVAQLEAALATERFNVSTQDYTVTADDDTETLPADFLIEVGIKVSTDGGTTFPYDCIQKKLSQLGTVANNNVKYAYAVYGSTLKISDPIPNNSSDVLRLFYITTPASLSDQTDTLQAPFVNSSHIFVKYALAMCYLKDKKVDEFKELRDDAERKLKQHISYLKRLSNAHPEFASFMNTRGL